MNSSGIKRGLAGSAVAALAVTGLPFLASSASAATGDEIQVAYVGPARNGGTEGAEIVLKTKGTVTPANLRIIASDLTGNVSTPTATDPITSPTQTVDLLSVGTVTADGPTNEFGGADGYAEIAIRVAVTTPTAGGTANFAVYEEEGTAGVQATEARTQVSASTAGVPASAVITPASQTAPVNQASGDYTVTLRDGAGRLTQLSGNENLDVTAGPSGVTVSNVEIIAGEAVRGTNTFTATGTSTGLKNISLIGDVDDDGGTVGDGSDEADGPAGVSATATLDVVTAATITGDELDIVTDADSWDGFNGGTLPATVAVRVDQKKVTLNFKSNDPAVERGSVVAITVTGTNLTFGGKASKTYTTTLSSDGTGSIDIVPDAASIADNSSFTITGSGFSTTTVNFERPSLATGGVVPSANTYVSGFGGSVDVTLKAVDQFGMPVAGVLLAVQRDGGVNDDTTPSAKKATGADGTVTFTLTDTKATAASNGSDEVDVLVYQDEFDSAPTLINDVADIVYTANGQGSDFALTIDGVNPTGSAYDPSTVTTNPLTDGVVSGVLNNANMEYINLAIANATTGAPVTVSVDNGGLVLKNGETTLAQGSASDSGVAGTDTFKIVGTKAGLTTVTVTSAGRTKTAQFTVVQTSPATGSARNIAVTGPAEAVGGDLATFTAKVTDAFGNGVAGITAAQLNIQVTGPARFQDSDAVTDANGDLKINVRLDDDADSAVGVRVVAAGFSQFGAAANHVAANDGAAPTGPGLSASQNIATATIEKVTDIASLEQAVEDAQEAVNDAEDALAAARGELRVAKAERSVAQKSVKQAKKALKKAKRQHKGVMAAQRELRNERGDLRIAKAKVEAKQAEAKRKLADLQEAQAELEAAEQELEDAQS